MNFEKARFNMVEQQIRPWEILDQDVLDVMMTVKREEFVPKEAQALAFAEIELPIGQGQTMLKPTIEGKILQAVRVRPTDSVLEVGAGSGYFAALLAAQADWVRTVEINSELVGLAHANLNRNGVKNVIVEEGDGSEGLPVRAPYNVIVVSGGLPELSSALLAQLAPGGRLFAFVGEAPVMKARLVICESEGCFRTEDLFETVVPMLVQPEKHNAFHF